MDIKNHSGISSPEESTPLHAASVSCSSQKACERDVADVSMKSKAKRIKKSDPARWDFAWGPPV